MQFHRIMRHAIRHILPLIVLVSFVLVLGRLLIPGQQFMFTFHDQTQGGRIQQFALNLAHGVIPPRIAPAFSFGMGYPVFTYYAPFPYWVGGIVHLLGVPIIDTIQVVFMMGLMLCVGGMYGYLRQWFDQWISVVGAIWYVSSLYIAIDVFVRGNIGEIWFLGLFPVALWSSEYIKQHTKRWMYVVHIAILVALFSSHNLFSTAGLVWYGLYVLLFARSWRHLLAIALSLLVNSYFLVPLIGEYTYVNAADIATLTKFHEHFLCWGQLWKSPWGYGASLEGCDTDAMSFMIGKPHVVTGVIGFIVALWTIIKNAHLRQPISGELSRGVFFGVITVASLFLTTHSSEWIWNSIEPMSVMQFPWRFIGFSLMGFAFLTAYLLAWGKTTMHRIPVFISIPMRWREYGYFALLIMMIIATYFINGKYFTGNLVSRDQFASDYLSPSYMRNVIVYYIPEYIPRSVNNDYWRSLAWEDPEVRENILAQPFANISINIEEPFNRTYTIIRGGTFPLPIHDMPNWRITVDGNLVEPDAWDILGRPLITAQEGVVHITYQHTGYQQAGNGISFVTIFMLVVYGVGLHRHVGIAVYDKIQKHRTPRMHTSVHDKKIIGSRQL